MTEQRNKKAFALWSKYNYSYKFSFLVSYIIILWLNLLHGDCYADRYKNSSFCVFCSITHTNYCTSNTYLSECCLWPSSSECYKCHNSWTILIWCRVKLANSDHLWAGHIKWSNRGQAEKVWQDADQHVFAITFFWGAVSQTERFSRLYRGI